MHEYTKLDDAIVAHLQRGDGHPTNSAVLSALAMEVIRDNGLSARIGWRVIDRRIQALKTAGRIALERKAGSGPRWRVVDAGTS